MNEYRNLMQIVRTNVMVNGDSIVLYFLGVYLPSPVTSCCNASIEVVKSECHIKEHIIF